MAVRIIVLAGKTFRGTYHFDEVKYDASPELARDAIEQGVAKLDLTSPVKPPRIRKPKIAK